MFNFLKKKLKSVVDSFTKKAEAELEKEEARAVSGAKEVLEKVERKEVAYAPEEKKASVAKEAVVAAEEKRQVAEEKKDVSEKNEIPAKKEPTPETGKISEEKPKEPVKRIEAEIVQEPAPKAPSEEEFKASLEEIRADLRKKAEEIALEEKKPKGVFGKVAAALKKEELKPVKPKTEEKKGILQKITEAVTTTKISEERFDELFEEMEMVLLENNVAVEVIDKIKDDMKSSLVDKPVSRGKVEKIVSSSLKQSIEGLFEIEKIDFIARVRGKTPYIVMFAGINGSGKTTTIAKIASMLQKNNLKVVIAASDTFRAAAIQQLQEHADRLGVKLIKHDYGADPAAVAFDAVKYAQAHSLDVVLIDTAGRQHSNLNLMHEMKKVVRVAKPDLKIFVGEAITGNDCVEQAKRFNEAINIDGIILSKADVDEKGGAAISVSYVTKKPIIYLGTGQRYEDLTPFNPQMVVESLGLAA